MEMKGSSSWEDREFHVIGEVLNSDCCPIGQEQSWSARCDQLSELATAFAVEGLPTFAMHWAENGSCSCGLTDCPSPGLHPFGWNGSGLRTGDITTMMRSWSRYPQAHIAVGFGGNNTSGLMVPHVEGANLQKAIGTFVDTSSKLWHSLRRRSEIYTFKHPCYYIPFHPMYGKCGDVIRFQKVMAIYDYSGVLSVQGGNPCEVN
jgi:hypothetical protein